MRPKKNAFGGDKSKKRQNPKRGRVKERKDKVSGILLTCFNENVHVAGVTDFCRRQKGNPLRWVA